MSNEPVTPDPPPPEEPDSTIVPAEVPPEPTLPPGVEVPGTPDEVLPSQAPQQQQPGRIQNYRSP